jgi:hypothetical protein
VTVMDGRLLVIVMEVMNDHHESLCASTVPRSRSRVKTVAVPSEVQNSYPEVSTPAPGAFIDLAITMVFVSLDASRVWVSDTAALRLILVLAEVMVAQ